MKENPSILVISHHFPPDRSGNASRIHDLSVNLANNTQVLIFAPFPSFPHGSFKRNFRIKKDNIINDRLKFINLWSWQPLNKDPNFISRMSYYLIFPLHACIWSLLYYRRYDVIVTSTPPIFTSITGLFVKTFLRKKWVIDKRDLWIDASIALGFLKKGSFFEKISRHLMNICLHRADLVCTTTTGISDKIKTNYNIQNTIIIPNGVDPDIFYPRCKKKKNQIIYAGNVGHAQDLRNCILAIKIVKQYKDLKLVIVGDGDIKEDLEALVKTENLEENVLFTGLVSRDKIPGMISESLIGLAPLKKMECLDYAAPTKVFEYMACGIPFLGCGTGEIERLAKESKAGIIADNTPESIARGILDLINNPEKSDEMGEDGINYISKYYDRKKIALKLYKNIQNYSVMKTSATSIKTKNTSK